jgi:hypothetical protein
MRGLSPLAAFAPNKRSTTKRTCEPLTRRAATALTPAGVMGATIVWESMAAKIAKAPKTFIYVRKLTYCILIFSYLIIAIGHFSLIYCTFINL